MDKKYDLNLSAFGPYNKEYLGVCHIADPELGATFNVELFPGIFRRKILVSHSSSDGGLKMWGASPNLKKFVYRYELEWKDRLYADAHFEVVSDNECRIRCDFTNATEIPQTVYMNLCASMQYPTVKCGKITEGYLSVSRAHSDKAIVTISGIDYREVRCSEDLASDGRYLGEGVLAGATDKGRVLSGEYFYSPEHFARYVSPTDSEGFTLRCHSSKESSIKLSAFDEEQIIPLGAGFSQVYVKLPLKRGDELTLSPMGDGVSVDALVFGEGAAQCSFVPLQNSVIPEKTVESNRLELKYPGICGKYIIEWSDECQMVRRYECCDIGTALTANLHDHVSDYIRTAFPVSCYEDVISKPLFLAAGETKTLLYTVRRRDMEDSSAYASDIPSETAKAESVYSLCATHDGEKYLFSQNMLAYNTLLNVVYPIYSRRGYIRHNTPGRNWDSLYTWDSGFIGMGLGVIDFDRAFDCLHAYLTPVGDVHSPFIFHGSVVPTQIFLYKYLFDKYPEKRERLRTLYPMVKQMFDFFANMYKREDQMKSGLLKTWNIFYNSGGWDDYPPQKYLHSREGLEGPTTRNTSPIITTAITVLTSRILEKISSYFGFDDGEDYRTARERYTAALEGCYNEEVGYYSYMVHGENGEKLHRLRAPDGTDFNMGFDGIYPYISGISTPDQSERMLENIKEGLLTEYGVGAVDTRASYYRTDGYWNGSVWLPHQWILWRSLFDRGEGELAFRIAKIALDLWKRETDETYSCFEHFMSENGRGCGFHQFSGLSTPALMFFETYYTPGTVTAGFDSVIEGYRFGEDKRSLELGIFSPSDSAATVVCLCEGEYSFSLNGEIVNAKKLTDAAYEIKLSKGKNRIIVK